ncbi:MAG: hydrogenase formation protein HypD [Chloroflexi bacterium]|nr:hydrogenase formation protein HypD [Chloroflexota bacterium]
MDLKAFTNSDSAKIILNSIKAISKKECRLMEFCGGHTMAIFKYGLRQLLPPNITLISGPGCPVCVTSTGDLDMAIALSQRSDVIITSFGDLLRIPSNNGTLLQARSSGADVRTVYSTLAALDIAKQNPHKKVVFIGIGFETTAPTIAAAIKQAADSGVNNFTVLCLCKLTPPVTHAILGSGQINLTGIIAPGHVSAIIGSDAWKFIPDKYRLPTVISGFEETDILYCLELLISQVEKNQAKVESAYTRSVPPQGNKVALDLMGELFESTRADWRGIGILPNSGLKICQKYQDFDTVHVLGLEVSQESKEVPGCICGDIIRGLKTPMECNLFLKGSCTPQNAKGPCMVSSEGTCAAYYQYGTY